MAYDTELKLIEQLQTTVNNKIRHIVNARLKALLDNLKAKYPKRSFRFYAGNGVAFFTIDGHIINIDFDQSQYMVSSNLFYYSNNTARLFILLYPLVEFIQFLDDIGSPTKCNDYYVDDYKA